MFSEYARLCVSRGSQMTIAGTGINLLKMIPIIKELREQPRVKIPPLSFISTELVSPSKMQLLGGNAVCLLAPVALLQSHFLYGSSSFVQF